MESEEDKIKSKQASKKDRTLYVVLGSEPKSGYIILAFKVTDDDRTELYDQGWTDWSGATTLTGMLSRKYEVIRVACYKGVNECPDVFKYIILIEFIILDGCDTHARDCMQRFRICRMSGYAALYQDFPSKDIEQAIEEEQSLNDMIETFGNVHNNRHLLK